MSTAVADPIVTREGTTDTQQVTEKPTRKDVIDAIANEVGCSRTKARRAIVWASQMVARSRETGYRTVYPTAKQLLDPGYRVFDRLFPHGRVPAPDSAGARLTSYVLDPGRGEFGLEHDRQEVGDLRFCTVRTLVNVLR